MIRKIDTIIVHCSATKAGLDFTAADIDRWHRERGFDGIGYHYVIRLDGQIEKGRDVALPGAHCRGWNVRSIGICYIGGLDAEGHPADTMTKAQRRVLYQLIIELQKDYPSIDLVIGHRDTSPDKNGDGLIEPWEYLKACPCFDVKEFMRSARALLFLLLAVLTFPFLLAACGSGKTVRGSSRLMADSVGQLRCVENRVEEKASFEREGEVTEEHIEETVLVFEGDSDSTSDCGGQRKLLSAVTRRRIDRKLLKGGSKEVSVRQEVTDSVSRSGHSVLKAEALSSEKEVSKSRRGIAGIFIFVLIMAGGGYFLSGHK